MARLPFKTLRLAMILFARFEWLLDLFAYKHHYRYRYLDQDLSFRAFEDWRGFKQYG
jgi:hypothetical protein